MNKDWLIPLAQWGASVLAMTILMGWVARSRLRDRPEADRHLLRHPASTLILGIVGAVLFFGAAIVSNTVGKNSTSTIWTTLTFVGLGCASSLAIADYFRARHRVSDSGIDFGRMLGERGRLRWADLRRVHHASFMKWFVLEGRSGTKVRVSFMLLGLPEFARLVLQHVPREVIEPDTLDLLQAAEQGQLPDIDE